ncbi:MAG: AraC family transcriptional regulator ligand-binding domain-containing protein [Cycloclasticus sp.]|nr:hypothetical protein A9Q80_00690 [Cycloclasticus sp. 46_83_sub15_T18]
MLTIPSHFVRAIVQGADRHGINSAELLQEQAISSKILQEEDGLVHGSQFVSLLQRIWETSQDEYIGMTDSRCIPGHFALMVRYVCQFHSVEALLNEMVRYFNTTREDVSLSVSSDQQTVALHVKLKNPELDIEHYLVKFMMTTLHRFICWITGQRIILDQVSFDYPQPAQHSTYPLLFPCSLSFEQSSNAFYFSTQYLALPLVRGWPEIKEFLKNSPADILLIPGSDNRYSTRIKGQLLEQQRAGRGIPDFNAVASELCISTPTLRRKLQAEHTSFQVIKDTIRRDLAIDKLVRERLPIASIGEQLGFIEPASFTRAFKQWTGVSPGEYRLGVR